MRSSNYNLQILRHTDIFSTREEALNFLSDYYKPESLDGEPVLVKYGDSKNPNVILAIGTSSNAPGSYYVIDFTQLKEQVANIEETVNGSESNLGELSDLLKGIINATGLTKDDNKISDKITYNPDTKDDVIGEAGNIAEAIKLLSEYTQNNIGENVLSAENTSSVNLMYENNAEGGKKLSANVNISSVGTTDSSNFNDNIINIHNDGIYAAAKLDYDEKNRILTFSTSGIDNNGNFKDDAYKKEIELGEHTTVKSDNENHTVEIDINDNDSNTVISGDVKISSNEDNILENKDGKLEVKGTASNIKFGDTTVASALTSQRNRINALETNVETNTNGLSNLDTEITNTLENAKTYIEEQINNLNSDKIGESEDHFIKVGITQKDGKITDVNVSTYNVASATDLSNEVSEREKSDSDLENKITDIDTKIGNIKIVKSDELQYSLIVNEESVGTIDIPKDQFLKKVDYRNHTLYLTFITSDGDVEQEIDISDLVDTYTAGEGLSLNNNVFSVAIDENSEDYMTITNGKLFLTGINAALAEKANTSDVYTKIESDNKYLTEHQDLSDYAKLTDVETVKTDVTNLTERVSNDEDTLATINGNEATEGSFAKGDADTLIKAKEYTDTLITEQQKQIDSNIETISTEVDRATAKETELENTLKDVVFVTKETNTAKLTADKQTGDNYRTLYADVKISNDSSNVISTDANGLYASVTMSYNKATNVLTFNNGGVDQTFELSNYGILQDAYYNSITKQIVLDVKKDDKSTSSITIDVADLLNTWSVENSSDNPITLNKVKTADNGEILTATLSIQDDEHNLLKNNKGSLFVDGDSNAHYAIWGTEATTVQQALNAAWKGVDKIDKLEDTVNAIETKLDNLGTTVSELQTTVNTEIASLKETISAMQTTISELQEKVENMLDLETY